MPRSAQRGWSGLIFVGLLALGAVNFGLQLGASSYFVDEVLSIQVSAHPLSNLLHAIGHVEIAPPGYFLFQHEWILRLGSQAEWVTRLPSVVFGVALVGGVYWLALVVTDRREAAAGSAALTALSPLVLQYSRLAQGYMLAALLVTWGFSATLAAARSREHARGVFAMGTLLAAGALCVNYTAAIPIAMLCVWLLWRGEVPLRWRVTMVAVCAAVQLALLPLFITQAGYNPGRTGVGPGAGVTWANVGNLARLPFAGPTAPLEALGIVLTLAALGTLALRWRRLTAAAQLVLIVAVGQPLILLMLSAFGARVAIVRYAVVAVPFVIVAVAAGICRWPRVLPVVGAAAVAVLCLTGAVAGHRRSGFYPDARGAVDFIQSQRRVDDAVISPVPPLFAVPLAYYGERRLRPVLSYAFSGSPQAAALIRGRRRLWVVSPLASSSVSAHRVALVEQLFARRFGYEVSRVRVFDSMGPLAVALWSPTPLG